MNVRKQDEFTYGLTSMNDGLRSSLTYNLRTSKGPLWLVADVGLINLYFRYRELLPLSDLTLTEQQVANETRKY